MFLHRTSKVGNILEKTGFKFGMYSIFCVPDTITGIMDQGLLNLDPV
jgi:hypothetical protein